MHIPPLSHRQLGVNQQGHDEYHPAEEQDKRRFAALLTPAANKKNDSAAPLRGSDTQNRPFRWEGASGLPLTPAWRVKNALSSSWLRWRLTNGPLAGLEIEACRQSDEMHIRLRGQDSARVFQQLGSAEQLEQQLAEQFGCRVIVEINDANSGLK